MNGNRSYNPKKCTGIIFGMVFMILITSLTIATPTLADDNSEPHATTPTPAHGTLTGTVSDAETGSPISNAIITLAYHGKVRIKRTDNNGQYTFNGVPICYCLKDVLATKMGYKTQYRSIPVGEMTYANFSLMPKNIPAETGDTQETAPGNDQGISDILSIGTILKLQESNSHLFIPAMIALAVTLALIMFLGAHFLTHPKRD